MQQWEYCEVDYDGSVTNVYFYHESGEYIDNPIRHPRLGVELAKLGHEGWEIISTWWRSTNSVTYMLKRPCQQAWTAEDSQRALDTYQKNHPKDRRY